MKYLTFIIWTIFSLLSVNISAAHVLNLQNESLSSEATHCAAFIFLYSWMVPQICINILWFSVTSEVSYKPPFQKNLLCFHHQHQLLVVETEQLCQTSILCMQLIGPRKFSVFINHQKLKSYIVSKFFYIRRTTFFSHIYL